MPQRADDPAVDDDPQVSRAIVRDLRARYGSDYRVVRATSGDEALGVLAELALRSRPVALLVSDQRMPGMTGIELMAKVRETSPDTRLLLLTAYADTDVAIRAINDIGLDYYMFKPWEPPESTLYPVVDDLLEAWRAGPPRRQLGRAGRRPPVVRPQLRREDVPGPQPHPLQLGRPRARRGGRPPARARGRRPHRPAAGTAARG